MQAYDPPGSRLFIVCGKSVEPETLQAAFSPFGLVENVKVIKEKGVAYVKFDRASSAALAIEHLNGVVLNDGRGPKLKVLLAEAPTSKSSPLAKQTPEPTLSADPDNVPPRSRLFVVVPKHADIDELQADIVNHPDVEYIKTDLVASKGVLFCKFFKTSSALMMMEDVNRTGMIAGYKVKCMLAEPKTKRTRSETSPTDSLLHCGPHLSPYLQSPQSSHDFSQSQLSHATPLMRYEGEYERFSQQTSGGTSTGDMGYGMESHHHAQSQQNLCYGLDAIESPMHLSSGIGHQDYALSNLSRLATGLAGLNNLQGLSPQHLPMGMDGLGAQIGLGLMPGITGHQGAPNQSRQPLSRQRLFVVVHKGVSEDQLNRLFRRYPGMEYCDLKKDRQTGRSKGYCYINYSTPEAAAAAVEQLNGSEFPPMSGHRLKVMFAEPLAARPPQIMNPMQGGMGMCASSGGMMSGVSSAMCGPTSGHMQMSPMSIHTPVSLRTMTADMLGMQSSMLGMSMTAGSHAGGGSGGADSSPGPHDALLHHAHALPSPMHTSVARELMFNVL